MCLSSRRAKEDGDDEDDEYAQLHTHSGTFVITGYGLSIRGFARMGGGKSAQ